MARYIEFSDTFLERVRCEVDLAELVERDLKLKRAGKNMVACCPFHNEKGPSFTVTPEKNTYRCYGCGVHGDAIEWMRNKHHMTFQDAVASLAELCGLALPVEERNGPEDAAQRKRLAGFYQVLKEARRIFARGLIKSSSGCTYLVDTRGLTLETIERFELGVVAKGVVELLTGSSSREALIGSGLAVEKDGRIFDRFRHRIMVPIHNESGNLIGFAGRSLIADPNKTPKYINCPETEIFHKGRELYALHHAKPAIRSGRVAVIVEGYFDVISLHQAGERRAVAPMGTALTKQQARRLLVHADTIVFAFDGDAAGRKAALAASAVLLDEIKDGKAGKFLFLPDGEDPDTFVRGHGIGAWLRALEDAMPLSVLLAEFVAHGLDRAMPESQVQAAEKAKAILARIKRAELFRRAMKAKFEEVIGVALH
jgi:DNA primase